MINIRAVLNAKKHINNIVIEPASMILFCMLRLTI